MTRVNTNRRSLYLGQPVKTLLELVGNGNFSQAVNRAVTGYLDIINVHRDMFSPEEWCVIYEATEHIKLDSAWSDIGDAVIVSRLKSNPHICKKWGVDQEEICKYLSRISSSDMLVVGMILDVFRSRGNCVIGQDVSNGATAAHPVEPPGWDE